jgi:hypothetical protein
MTINRASSTALLALLLATHPAAANWEYTRWGMTPAQVVKASSGLVLETATRATGEGSGFYVRAKGVYPSGPLHLNVDFGFDSTGGLAFVTYSIDSASENGALESWLVGRYGPPQTKQTSDEGIETWTWNRPGLDSVELNVPDGEPGFVIQSPGQS